MNKIILLLLILSSIVSAGEEEGSGTTPNSAATNETVYQLVCISISEQNYSTQQDNNQYCVLVPVLTDS